MSDHDHDHLEVANAPPVHETKDPAAENSEAENDTFEDANDTTNTTATESAKGISIERTRSLTDRRSSSVESQAADRTSDSHTVPSITEPVTEAEPETETETNGDGTHSERGEHTEHSAEQPKSPLLTTHRISTTSLDNVNLEQVDLAKDTTTQQLSATSLDNVSLEEDDSTEDITPKVPEKTGPALPPRTSKPSLQGLAGVLPSVPWGPPPAAPQVSPLPTAAPAPVAAKRSLTSPFSWLSRNTTSKDTSPSPPVPLPHNDERRNTSSSIMTVSSNPEIMLGKLDEISEPDSSRGRPSRNSLKDRFKLLRMREEAGIATLGEDENVITAGSTRRNTVGLGLAHSSGTEEKEISSPTYGPSASQSPDPSINLALSPGTAAGAFAGPSAMSDPSIPVDWDLWQSVVYEGPSAVARTSPDELNKAIASGIPNAIRGVVWQVLAQSKNEELEGVYRDLVHRGTDKEKDRMSGSSGPSSASPHEEVASSASSVRSDHSTPATTQATGIRSPSPPKEKDIEAVTKATAANRKKKTKEDAAALAKLEKMIRRDMGARTSFSKFATSSGLQEGLFGVCKAYALFDEGVGYAQGMNFLAMPILFNMPEEEAFCLLVRLMNQYHLRELFIHDMPGLHKHLYQFERALEDFEPALYCHLRRRQITPHLYATQWFLTLFAYRFPLQLVLRIYDLILSEGLEAIIRFGIVLMQKNATTLLGMNDMVQLTTFLRDRLFDVYIDQAPSHNSILESGFFGSSGANIDKEVYHADQMIQDACAVKLTPELLKAYTLEWEEKTKSEKDRETELESLKTSNLSLTKKVRQLEERAESLDSEHAALATQLVRTKVENEQLGDQNESLNGQVEELRRVVEKQSEEVENRLRGEMDQLMNRNQEVHGENTRLEDEMAEMEKRLVETKMMHAELNASHETLLRKWTDLRKALD